jgi:hypothetical protein
MYEVTVQKYNSREHYFKCNTFRLLRLCEKSLIEKKNSLDYVHEHNESIMIRTIASEHNNVVLGA